MSLDVTLRVPGKASETRARIIIRDAGQTREVTREEWDRLNPGREPVMITSASGDEVYTSNITHNLNKMADAADIYNYLWRPDEINVKTARELVEPLTDGLVRLAANPAKFKQFNPANGWGNYDGFINFVAQYIEACRKYPDAIVEVSR